MRAMLRPRITLVATLSVVVTTACGVLFPLDDFREHGTSDGGSADAATDAPDANTTDDAGPSGRYARAVLDDHPVLYLRFGEKSGAPTARDETAGHRDGSYGAGARLGAAGLIAGDPDTAARFDGTAGSNVVIPSGLDFAHKAPFSVEVWAVPTASPQFMWPVDHQTYGSQRHGWGMDFAKTNVNIERWNANQITGASSGSPLRLNEKHHVVGTFDGTASVLYIDGVKVADDPTAIDMDPVDTPWTAGAQNCGGCTGSNFVGTLDELAVYDYALGPARVAVHYDIGTGH